VRSGEARLGCIHWKLPQPLIIARTRKAHHRLPLASPTQLPRWSATPLPILMGAKRSCARSSLLPRPLAASLAAGSCGAGVR
jgi:hypothetical protein